MQNNQSVPRPQQGVPPVIPVPPGGFQNSTTPSQPTMSHGVFQNGASGSAQTPPAGSTPPKSMNKPPQTPPLSNNTYKRPIRSDYPKKLELVDDGRVVAALKSIRANCEKTSPNEIYLVLNPSGVAEAAEAQFSQKAHRLEGWRNGLILLPIMFTWISLGLAGLAYTQSIVKDPKLVAEPLLQQWAEGFTILQYVSVWSFHLSLLIGKWRYFSFGDVAVLDFMLFVVLLFLTIRAHAIEVQASQDAIELGTWLREECDILREHTFARVIGQGPGGDTPEWAVLVNKTISNLQDAMMQVVASIRTFDDVLQGDRETVSKALTAVDNLNAIYEAGRRTYEKLEATLPRMDMSFEKMADSQNEAVRSLDKIATSVNNSSNAVVQLAQPFAKVGVANLAKETFDQLQRIQSQQTYIQDSLAQQMNAVNQMKPGSHRSAMYRWWDIRRFF